MKKLLLLLLVLCLSITVSAQTLQQRQKAEITASLDSLVHLASLSNSMQLYDRLNGKYELYKTQNIYTFLKLNTVTGQIDQIQWSMDSDKEGTVSSINSQILSGTEYGAAGRFVLYSTQNIYTFLLLDTYTGTTWHVQWNLEANKRGMWLIQ